MKFKPILKNSAFSILFLGTASLLAGLLKFIDKSDFYVPLLFVLAVFLISRFTDGYVYGIVSSILGVFCVNYVFTYPYLAFNFTISGYPVTFMTMLIVSIITSTLNTRIKQQELIRIEVEKEKMYSNLLRSVSHDIRTPLTSIIGSAGAVLQNENVISDEKKHELLQNVVDEADWLIRIVENLLSITRIDSNTAHINKNDEAVEEIMGETALKFRKHFPNILLKVSVPDELLLVPMDAVLIEQVILNLLENAVLHGEVTTEIQLSAYIKGDFAEFIVRDNGKGIKKNTSRLFEMGSSTSSGQSSDKPRNMGIGLCVCSAIVKAHGGEIKAKNLREGGAEFSFKLPLYNAIK